ncbi:acyl-CoA dehydrogenase [Marinobacter nauticus]|uniref:acyl-CoA dehydrogenase n=1 Tax=Marinobacter nauticus TaxID=2743 RepID=UPI001C9590D8|nr:acyl-CoA dehydrogenase [Marinobacter nauticus]MBY5937472.1 acyl-CoA dehydrogenase [Marinobacter nauticus]MBY5954285.1 acyl-CoA dehydrogenase [Marinobacter nauticus]MBY5963506.1 acyl-CoA dehydrogenase [Marinobacter nauticus]MBY6008493.1 acyl-CoA dehydrogenase [Marinobacter nauticus]MBY6101607.1 acyl-CoA dehydrogenase [Marinobacter nauticus]
MSVLLLVLSALVLIYFSIGGKTAALIMSVATLIGVAQDDWHILSFLIGGILLALALLVTLPGDLRLDKLSRPLLGWVRSRLPKLSPTEQEALNSGSVDWDGELFSGQPEWNKLLDAAPAHLTSEEQAFLDGPVEELCKMLDDWQITHEHYDLPDKVWKFIRSKGFFGLVIPKEDGGLGFSNTAHSEIVMKISTRSVSAAVTVMVPNSLGPGELLMHYGTDEQKQHYLPRLAGGEEIPCFALTSPVAGSDAGAIPDKGIVCKGEWNGKEVLGLKVTWNKRYITLAPVATLIGLAIKVYDPEHLLGEQDEIGVTCVMVPRDTDGVNAGARHLPMNTVFMNGPTWGTEVFIPMEQVIGGQDMLGKGWKMLLECLSIGRSISLPALGTGAGKLASLATGSYAYTREQFGRSISQFEGVQEALEPIAGYTYMMDAARLLTAGMLDRGVRPSVPSAVLKYRNTDLMREVINHAMDVVAGRGVITGPRNFLARAYQAVPIGITVEGANILTRSLMVFGQGAIRCHPFIVEEIEAAGMEDQDKAAKKFDGIFYRHLAHTTRNALRAFVLGLSKGWLESAPRQGDIQKYYRQLGRFSAAFALMTDVTLLTVGGGLKARQRLSGRMADCLVHLYYATAVIKQWHEEGYPDDQRDLVEWCLQSCLHDLQDSMREAIINFPVPALRWPLRLMVFPLGATGLNGPDDKLGAKVAATIVNDTPVRQRISRGTYINADPSDSLGRVLNAYRLANETEESRHKLHEAIRSRDEDEVDGIALLMGHQRKELVDWACAQGIVKADECPKLEEALTALYDVIRVDAFDADGLKSLAKSAKGKRKVVERPSKG